MHSPGAPVSRPVTSAAKPAEPSCAVSTKSTPPRRMASISGKTLPLGMPKPRSIPAALRVATIRSALFMERPACGGPVVQQVGALCKRMTRASLEILQCLCDICGAAAGATEQHVEGGILASNAELRYLIDTYLDWTKRQQVPIVEGVAVDLHTVET